VNKLYPLISSSHKKSKVVGCHRSLLLMLFCYCLFQSAPPHGAIHPPLCPFLIIPIIIFLAFGTITLKPATFIIFPIAPCDEGSFDGFITAINDDD